MGSEVSAVVEDALKGVRLMLGREIELQKPPLVLDYLIDSDLITDALREAARAMPRDASDPISLTISNVEVDLGGDDAPSALREGKHLGLTLRWPSTGREPEVPPSVTKLVEPTGSYAYAVDRDGEASITVLLRDLAT